MLISLPSCGFTEGVVSTISRPRGCILTRKTLTLIPLVMVFFLLWRFVPQVLLCVFSRGPLVPCRRALVGSVALCVGVLRPGSQYLISLLGCLPAADHVAWS